MCRRELKNAVSADLRSEEKPARVDRYSNPSQNPQRACYYGCFSIYIIRYL